MSVFPRTVIHVACATISARRATKKRACDDRLAWKIGSVTTRVATDKTVVCEIQPNTVCWDYPVDFTTLQLLREIPKTMEENRVQLEQFEDRIIFMPMHNDIDWRNAENTETCVSNSLTVAANVNSFLEEHWSFLGPGSEEKKGTERSLTNQTRTPFLSGTSAFSRQALKSKGGGRTSIHFK